MTPRREANDRPHGLSPAGGGNTILRLSLSRHNRNRCGNAAGYLRRFCISRLGRARHFALLRTVAGRSQVRVVWSGGVASWRESASDRVGGQSLLGNKSSLSLCSVNAWWFARAASSRRDGFPNGSTAPSATPTLSSKASASRTRGPRLRSMPRSSGEDSRLKLSCDFRAAAAAEIKVVSYPSPMHDGWTWEECRPLNNGDSLVLQSALTGRGPCDSGAFSFVSPRHCMPIGSHRSGGSGEASAGRASA